MNVTNTNNDYHTKPYFENVTDKQNDIHRSCCTEISFIIKINKFKSSSADVKRSRAHMEAKAFVTTLITHMFSCDDFYALLLCVTLVNVTYNDC